jgi:uncharacterized membrane protein
MPGGKPSDHSELAQSSIEVEAPVWRVYEAWSHPERFAEFMPDIHQVMSDGQNRFRWEARGPEGKSVHWITRLTENIPNRLIAWRSVSGEVDQTCEVEMEALSPLHTRLTMRMNMATAPESPIQHWLHRLFGHEPARQVGNILENFREVIEFETFQTKSPTTEI